MTRTVRIIRAYIALFFVLLIGCEDPQVEPNPFENIISNQDTVNFSFDTVDAASILGIYQNTFGPTCANIGCHDGTFEPDFRTVESAYNSLLFQVPIKNDGSLVYRVKPGSLSESALHNRITGLISPAMPIEIEPDSDWPTNKSQYIKDIENWILDGAPDIMGIPAGQSGIAPSITGLSIYVNDIKQVRPANYRPIKVTADFDQIEFLLSVNEELLTQDISKIILGIYSDSDYTTQVCSKELLRLSDSRFDYGLSGTEIAHHYTMSFNLDCLTEATSQWYVRADIILVDDSSYIVPHDEVIYYIKDYLSFELL